jgi:hypothetical protein
VQVLPTQLVPDEKEGKILRVRLIMKEGKQLFDPIYLFDQGSTVSWIPCGRKLTCSFPGIKMFYGPDTYYGEEVSVLEMDGQFDKLEELIYMESHLRWVGGRACVGAVGGKDGGQGCRGLGCWAAGSLWRALPGLSGRLPGQTHCLCRVTHSAAPVAQFPPPSAPPRPALPAATPAPSSTARSRSRC